MNYLESRLFLRNRYFIMRHGQSVANVIGKVVSDPKNGVSEYGLSVEGKEQVRLSVEQQRAQDTFSSQTIIQCSDFLRCRETASIVCTALATSPAQVDIRLRERFFGVFEGALSFEGYLRTWAEDLKDTAHHCFETESTGEVLARTTQLVGSLEDQYVDQTILLVSHGDTSQILQTAFERLSPSQHRTLPTLRNAEIRELTLRKKG